MNQLPTYDRLMNPVLQALRQLGGSGSTDEIYQRAAENLKLPDSVLSMVVRADKGLFITRGTFSRDAIKEATSDGAPPIDLVDGDLLADKLKQLQLGVTTTMIESVSVNESWFGDI